MKVDGLNLLEGSSITNAAIASGPSFPSSPDGGELFYIIDVSLGETVGLYFYDADATWKQIATTAAIQDYFTTTPTSISYGVAFPGTPADGEVFYLTGAISGYAAGLYYYDLVAVDWQVASSAGGTFSSNVVIPTGYHITITDAPVNGTDATNKNYVDANLAGLSWKQAVKAATTTNITLSGTQTIDGVAVVASDRVLVKDQSTTSANGIYVVAAGAWARALDMDATTPINELNSAAVFVEQGTVNADSGWTQINNISTLGSDAVSFTQFNGSANVTAGVGLVKTGNVLDVNLGAGVSQLSTDEVGIDLYAGGGLMLTVDGTASSTLTAAQLSLTKVGTAGTYKSVTTDDFGRVTAGSNPTTLSGYGITDAQALDADLTAIAALAGSTGILTKTGANTWALDNASYLKSLTDTLSSVTGRGATTADAISITNATASTSTSTGALIVTGGVGVGGAVTAANLSVANGTVTSATLTTSATTSNQVVLTLSATAYRSVAYQIQVTSGSSYHATQILAIHDGTTVSLTEFATIFTGVSLAIFDADISGGNIRLLVTPTNAVSTIKVIETAINI